MKKLLLLFLMPAALCMPLFLCGCGEQEQPQKNTMDIARERAKIAKIAQDAYVYGFPLVLSEITKRYETNPLPATGRAPINQIKHISALPDDKYRGYPYPDDSLFFSFAWLDLSKEPFLIEIPETGGKYAVFKVMNGWTDIFVSEVKRGSVAKAVKIAITGPRWEGEIPKDFVECKSKTVMAKFEFKIQSNGKQDAGAKKIQDSIKLYPLSSYGKRYVAPKGKADDTLPEKEPLEQVMSMNISEFFNLFNQLLINNPPYPEDAAILDRILDLGVAPGMRFDIAIFEQEVQALIKDVPKWMKDYMSSLESEGAENVWKYHFGTGSYGTNYRLRAKTAYFSFGADLNETEIFITSSKDVDGEKYNGSRNKYILHLDKENIPPVSAYWSLSAYDENGLFIKNVINRFSVGSRNPVKYNKDGSVDIYIQKDNPGKDRQSNWLPAGDRWFTLMLRCYLPKEEILEGKWKIPAVKKAN